MRVHRASGEPREQDVCSTTRMQQNHCKNKKKTVFSHLHEHGGNGTAPIMLNVSIQFQNFDFEATIESAFMRNARAETKVFDLRPTFERAFFAECLN